MIITNWNVNGLRAVAKKSFFPWIQTFQPDILCLQETKIQQDQLTPDLTEITGYQSFFSFAEKKGYSGTALYTRIQPDLVKTTSFPDNLEGEGRIVEAHYRDFILWNVYFPNGQMSDERLQYKLRFYDTFLDYIQHFRKKGKRLILTGDFNTAHQPIDLAEPKKNEKNSGFLPSEREKVEAYLQYGLVDVFRKRYPTKVAYTYWSYFANARARNLGWRIDYFLVTPDMLDQVADIVIHAEVMGSDHCPLSLVLR